MSMSDLGSGLSEKGLKKSFGLFALFVYGLGDILGAGIYALIGTVTLQAGQFVWVSFAIALLIATLTALSYSELVARFPKSGGVSHFADQAFGKKSVTFTVGWLLLFVSIVSMATLSRAFTNYAGQFGIDLPHWVWALAFLSVLGAVNFRGIRESSNANIVATLVEVSGLALIIAAAIYFLGGPQAAEAVQTPNIEANIFSILTGAALAFYAFIGFEDLANVAEESRDPKKHMPIAILGSLLVAGLIYMVIGWLAPQVVDPSTLTATTNMLPEVMRKSGLGVPVWIFSLIAIFAVANTCLLNFITGSRLLYGMSQEKVVPRIFSRIHKKYQTPHIAIAFVFPLAFALTVFGDLKFLASTTSVLILLVFCSSNLSLLVIKRKRKERGGFQVPQFIPVVALLANIGLIVFADQRAIIAAGAITLLGVALHFIFTPRPSSVRSSFKR